jgi:hypothetical protein
VVGMMTMMMMTMTVMFQLLIKSHLRDAWVLEPVPREDR